MKSEGSVVRGQRSEDGIDRKGVTMICEAGLFNQGSGGVMIYRKVFGVKNKRGVGGQARRRLAAVPWQGSECRGNPPWLPVRGPKGQG